LPHAVGLKPDTHAAVPTRSMPARGRAPVPLRESRVQSAAVRRRLDV